MKTKKTFKSIIAFALALILSLGVVSTAFAANGGSITWTVDGETATCTYHSDLEVGVNNVKIAESGYYYFDLSELENGYYSAKLTNDVFEYFCTPEKSGSKYEGWGNMKLVGGVEHIIFNRKENVDIAVAGAYGESDGMIIEIEYLGEDIESVEIENADELIAGYDIHNYGTNEWAGNFDTKVTFTGGKTFEKEDLRCYFSFVGEPQKGENTVNLTFIDYTSEQVLNVGYISDYISGIEADIPEGTAAYVYYDYDYDIISTVDEIIVNFTDGTKQTVNPNQYPCTVTLPNGREVDVDCIYNINPNTLTISLNVFAGAHLIGTVEIGTEKASFSDNNERFKYNASWYFERIGYRMGRIAEVIANGEFQEIMPQVRYLFNTIGRAVEGVANQIGLFAKFMLA